MKKIYRTYLLAALVVFAAQASVSGQDFSSVLSQVEANNPTIKALRAEADAVKAETRTSLNLSNPSLEFNYLWGTGQADRVDLGVAQEFDFPTAYYWRKKAVQGEISRVEYEYKLHRQEILLQTQSKCIEMVYYNAIIKELERRLSSATSIAESYQKQFDRGEISILDLNKAKLNLLNATKEIESNKVEMDLVQNELQRLNGGEPVKVSAGEFGMTLLPNDFDSWIADACQNSPELQALTSELEAAKSSAKLATAEALPKFSLGYVSERQDGTTLQGVGFGVSIPLWESRGKVKAAKAKAAAVQARIDDSIFQYENSLRANYQKTLSLQKISSEYRQMLSSINSGAALDRALALGEISMVDYLLEVDVWYEALVETLSSERDAALLFAEITSWEL